MREIADPANHEPEGEAALAAAVGGDGQDMDRAVWLMGFDVSLPEELP